jgi:hypothetical protein
MEPASERVHRGYLSSGDIDRLYAARVVRIARGQLSYADIGRINEQASLLDRGWRRGDFNGLQYFHFQFPEHGAVMAGFLQRERLHRLVPGSSRAPTPEEVDTEWRRRAAERDKVLAWARKTKMLMEIVQAYRFERRQGGFSTAAHEAAAKVVEQTDRTIADPSTYAGMCIEWAEREYREWFWRCAPNHQVL